MRTKIGITKLLRPYWHWLESEIASVQESLTSMRVIKHFAREDYEAERLEKQDFKKRRMALKARGIKARLSPLVDVIVAIGTCLALWYGTDLVLSNELSTGALLVFICTSARCTNLCAILLR